MRSLAQVFKRKREISADISGALPDGTVKAACGSGFYTKPDLGIVKYHFETVTEKKTV